MSAVEPTTEPADAPPPEPQPRSGDRGLVRPPHEPPTEPIPAVGPVEWPHAPSHPAAVPNAAVPNAAVPNAAVPNALSHPAAVPNTAVPNTAVPNTTLPTSPWSFVDVFAGLGVVLLVSLLVSAPLRIASWDGGSAGLVMSALPVWIGLLGTAVWACRRHGTGNLVRDLGLTFKPIDLAIGLGAGLGLRFAVGIWAIVYSSLTGQQPTSNLESILENGLGTGFWLVTNMLAIAVIGPVIEEVFFRGLGLRSALASLWRRSGTPRFADPRRRVWVSIAVTSTIFALLHVSEVNDLTSAAVLMPGLFLAGWVLARLTTWSGRLGPAIVTHVVFNGVAVAALLALGG